MSNLRSTLRPLALPAGALLVIWAVAKLLLHVQSTLQSAVS